MAERLPFGCAPHALGLAAVLVALGGGASIPAQAQSERALATAGDAVHINYIGGADAAELEAREQARQRALMEPQLQAERAAQARAKVLDDFFHMLRIDRVRNMPDFLAQGVDVNTPAANGSSPLVLALQQESYRVAAWLAAQPQVDIEALSPKQENALMLAAIRGQKDIVATLLQRGAQVNRDGFSALHYAASAANAEIVQMLIDAGATLDSPADSKKGNRYTPLMMAAMYGSAAVVQTLLAAGADATARARSGHTIVELARNLNRDFLIPMLSAAYQEQTERNHLAKVRFELEQAQIIDIPVPGTNATWTNAIAPSSPAQPLQAR